MSTRIVVDPITRIEGHLRIDVEVDGGKVKNSWSSGQMFRGIEIILQGRDPRDAWLFTQRFCGVCTTVHAITSVRAVENALKLEIPVNAQLIRNLILIAHGLHDHIVHFYHLSALDWVDVVSALKADPAGGLEARREPVALAGQQHARARGGQGPARSAGRQRPARHLRERLLGPSGDEAAAGGQPARGQPLPAGARLPAQGEPGRRDPRRQDAEHPEPRGRRRRQRHQPRQRGDAEHDEALRDQGSRSHEVATFVQQVYSPTSSRSARCIPTGSATAPASPTTWRCPTCRSTARRPSSTCPAARSWAATSSPTRPIRRLEGRALPGPGHRVDRPRLVRRRLAEAPVGRGDGAEVHRLRGRRQVLLDQGAALRRQADAGRSARPGADGLRLRPAADHQVRRPTSLAIARQADRQDAHAGGRPLHPRPPPGARHPLRGARRRWRSTHWGLPGRATSARATPRSSTRRVFPKGEQRGFGVHEAPRGTLSHWVVIRDGKIANYQAVVPVDLERRPARRQGPARPLRGLADRQSRRRPERPLEVVRTIHSFDPCIACAIHTLDPDGTEVSRVRAL